MSNILLLGSGTQALAILKSLHKTGNRIVMLVNETGNYADVSRFVNKRIVTNHSALSIEYHDLVKATICEEKIDVVIPMGDSLAEFLSLHKEELSPLVHFKMPSHDNFMKGYDKNQLMTLCRAV